uniref:BRCT domain-containing protein n=1 Tax=Trichuris muris TaxID=70415 RepID=A0A5S6QCI6_TRIMR
MLKKYFKVLVYAENYFQVRTVNGLISKKKIAPTWIVDVVDQNCFVALFVRWLFLGMVSTVFEKLQVSAFLF